MEFLKINCKKRRTGHFTEKVSRNVGRSNHVGTIENVTAVDEQVSLPKQ